MSQPIVIIGGGIIGAAIAYHLSRRGAQVLVVDGGGGTATAASFGWINASFFLTPEHFQLRKEGMAAWERLAADLPGVYDPCGAVVFDGEADGEALSGMGYTVEDLSASAFAERFPGLKVPPAGALSFPTEGAADPALVAQLLLEASSARVIRGALVQEIRTEAGQVTGVRLPGGVIEASSVVVAAGCGTPGLLAPLGCSVPLLERPGVTLVSAPVALRLSTILATPAGEVRALPGGRLLASASVSHQSDASETVPESLDALAATVKARIEKWVPVQFAWQEMRYANRPMPADGLPAIGPLGPEGLWVAVMHSGVTLAPVVGELLAREILDGAAQPLLRSVRPQRLSS